MKAVGSVPSITNTWYIITVVHCVKNVTKTKLEIWGKAQRESAQHPKSDWGKLGGVKRGREFPQNQSHVAQTQMHWHTPNALRRLRVGQH